jgi:hypothetical protein
MNAGNFEQSEIGAVVMDVVLHAGDFLYFPRGWIHQVCTQIYLPAPCVSLTVCVSCVCRVCLAHCVSCVVCRVCTDVDRRWRLRRTRTRCI